MDATSLAHAHYSLDHDHFQSVLSRTQNLLIIQDLDGVCMPLVKDPLNRHIDPDYITTTEAFDGHFYVLTNGEHLGKRGVNAIVERAFGADQSGKAAGHYLPGLAAGGVQWQDRWGMVSHPGVSDPELAFLQGVITAMEQRLRVVLPCLGVTRVESLVAASVLDNVASPTVNLNLAYEIVGEHYPELQTAMHRLMTELLKDAQASGLTDAFFVHYAPNLGQDQAGNDILRPATTTDSGTTDFQFMVRGGIKEAGVVALLNRYYHQHFGYYPLGPEFNVRQAPASLPELQGLILEHFDPEKMPLLVGVGDTVTSRVTPNGVQRGGSDRNFLQLIHNISQATEQPHLTVYVDSSRGEVKNRKSLKLATIDGVEQVAEGPGDPDDRNDPLRLNVAFPGGYKQYTACIKAAAQNRAVAQS
ncbi:glucosylglycerol 3-phosphatase [Spirulina major]|uniref:glucosylglycerol 3-phosphatase n=1 Tax=Spirulina major TaxID=270636 RepID=UPI0009339CDF|nr:glucosylglycerol 3-phosphatase [Spirulina major]